MEDPNVTAPVTNRTRSKSKPPPDPEAPSAPAEKVTSENKKEKEVAADPQVTPEADQKEKSGNKVKKKKATGVSALTAEDKAKKKADKKEATKTRREAAKEAKKKAKAKPAAPAPPNPPPSAEHGEEGRGGNNSDLVLEAGATKLFEDAPSDGDDTGDDENSNWTKVKNKRTAGKTKLNREEAAAKRKEIKAAKKAEAAEKSKKRNETPTGESSQSGSSTPQRTGKQTRLRRVESTYSSCFILSCQGVTNGKMPEMMQKCMRAVLNVGNDIEEVCFEHLSDSLTAPILFSEGDIPQRNTKLRAYIRVVSGGERQQTKQACGVCNTTCS